MTDLTDDVAREMDRWKSDASESAAWDARALVDRLRKGGDAARAVDFGEDAVSRWPEFEPLQGALAWAYYRRDIASVDPDTLTAEDRQQTKTALARIRSLTASDPYGKYSAWPLSALQVARLALTRWQRSALDILYQIDPDKLGTEFRGDYPSNAARWHLGMTKALEELEEWDDLLATCERALAADGLRDEDIRWIRRRRAFALEHLGRPDEAVDILDDLRRHVSDWWADADLARVLRAAGRTQEAMDTGRLALDKPGPLAAKWRTVMLVGELLIATDEELAHQHLQLARHLRQKEGWPPHRELEEISERAGVQGPPPEHFDITSLGGTWRNAVDPARMSGVVKAILSGEQSGFLSLDDGGDIYFAMPRNGTESAPPVGTVVTFRLVDAFDRKKNQPSKKAIDVRFK
jgi:tetratricopeptide (TPR) repeat protein